MRVYKGFYNKDHYMESTDRIQTYTSTTELYDYQEADINLLMSKLMQAEQGYKLLYQLPTGGGKTVIFSEIVNRFVHQYSTKVMILTHRQELSVQTSATLRGCGIRNKIINSAVKRLSKKEDYRCYVAMVETLNNRINDGLIDTSQIGLVIIDEAHHNSFQKLLDKFEHAKIIGVTATPFSSDISLPMRDTYHELIVGESIESLISRGYLAEPTTWRYDVELNTLQKSKFGDFTVSSSDELYASPAMLDLLLHAYEEHSKNKKTLIFNNGIFASKAVCQMFNDAGYPARHLDNETSAEERIEILKWLKKTKNAILTSVSILTTGFDEPSVQTVVLYRATTSLTLYHQMIGRGSRRLPSKKKFSIIDLGNNTDRFGAWNTAVDWQFVFENPEAFSESLHMQIAHDTHQMPSEMRAKFPNSLEISFDIQKAYHDTLENHQKAKTVIDDSLSQHVQMCLDNSNSVSEALLLAAELDKEIDWRVKQYGKCLGKVTKNYLEWLRDDYKTKLKEQITQALPLRNVLGTAV